MMDNVIEAKSFALAIRVVNLYKYVSENEKEYVLSKQMLRCGTSIGANVAEAEQAQSRADFRSKLCIALKEAAELKYWIKLMHATDYLTDKAFHSIYPDCVEVEKLLVSIIKATK